MANNNAVAVKKDTVDIVLAKVQEFQNTGELRFPVNYIPENALKSAWLTIQETMDRNNKPALDVCTKDSIANSLLSMVIQGLNPDKKQCYFIVYGQKLQLQRSYFGSMAVAKSVDQDIEDIYAMVVYEGDELEYEIKRGRRIITKHIQKIENVSKKNIVAAYACVLYMNGREDYTLMTFDEIKQAWSQSKMNPVDNEGNVKVGSTHDKFSAEMAMKTVINKACKPIINSSSDRSIVSMFAQKMDTELAELEAQEEISENANSIDLEAESSELVQDSKIEATEAEYQEVKEEAETPKTPDEATQLGIKF